MKEDTAPTREELAGEVDRLAQELDRIRAEYALVPKALWKIMKTWPPALSRAAMTAGFTMSLNDRSGLQAALWLLPDVVCEEGADV